MFEFAGFRIIDDHIHEANIIEEFNSTRGDSAKVLVRF